jgi:hypothetical protein
METGADALAAQDRCNRFAGLSRVAAGGILALLLALIVVGLNLPARRTPVPSAPGRDDIGLYSRVIDRVRAGERYARAAIAEQRAAGYPVRPFVAVRPPLLAVALAWLPDRRTADILLASLAAIVIVAWTARLKPIRTSVAWLAATPLIVFTGVEATMTLAGMSRLHETWAGLLIALSLALRTDRRFAAAVTLGLLAGLVREIAMPYLVVMALVALAERRRAEAVAFVLALAACLAALTLHAATVTPLLTSHDMASPGWVTFGGWRFAVSTAKWNYVALLLGAWAGAVILPLAIVGAMARKDGLGIRLTFLVVGYAVGFMAIGRPWNSYWGLITAPLIGVALCFAPWAVGDLLRGAVNDQAAAPT